jgi:hypothetical protein
MVHAEPGMQFSALNWMEVGEPPSSIEEARDQRWKKIRPYATFGGGFLIGGFAGFAGIVLWPGAWTWLLPTRVELFLAVAIPVGVVEFFLTGWMVPRIGRLAYLRVRRVAVHQGKLRIELTSGSTIEWALKSVRTSQSKAAPGWYAVWSASGRVTPSFYAPEAVTRAIADAPRE